MQRKFCMEWYKLQWDIGKLDTSSDGLQQVAHTHHVGQHKESKAAAWKPKATCPRAGKQRERKEDTAATQMEGAMWSSSPSLCVNPWSHLLTSHAGDWENPIPWMAVSTGSLGVVWCAKRDFRKAWSANINWFSFYTLPSSKIPAH